MYSLFSEEAGNAILANVLPVLQKLAHGILHVREDMSLSCNQKKERKMGEIRKTEFSQSQ